MPTLDPEYVGKLPPGAAEDLKQSLRDYRQLAKQGLLRGVKILSGPGCPVSEGQHGKVYQVDRVPTCVRN